MEIKTVEYNRYRLGGIRDDGAHCIVTNDKSKRIDQFEELIDEMIDCDNLDDDIPNTENGLSS